MADVYCKYCGHKANTVAALTSGTCMHHPLGVAKGKHGLYEGSTKSQYACKNCGHKANSISALTSGTCMRHPNGVGKGKHESAM